LVHYITIYTWVLWLKVLMKKVSIWWINFWKCLQMFMTPRFVILNIMKYDCTTWTLTENVSTFLSMCQIQNKSWNHEYAFCWKCWKHKYRFAQWLIFKSECSCSMINVTMQPFLPTLAIHLHSTNIHGHAQKYNLEKEGFKDSIML
jgi:hypothetical protein